MLLEELEQKGLHRAVASSSTSKWVKEWLTHHRLTDRFEAVVCRDHVDRPKPAPDVYLLAARYLGVEPKHCLAIEDSPAGFRAARAAGMPCLAVPNALTAHLEFPSEARIHAEIPRLHQIYKMGLRCSRSSSAADLTVV